MRQVVFGNKKKKKRRGNGSLLIPSFPIFIFIPNSQLLIPDP